VADIVLDDVTKRFPDGFEAVKHMNLEIRDGEFMVLVGPSGCGKSTALRMIAGLEEISEGELRIGGDVVNHMSPRERDIAMVFQNYALYPHMTVRENMGFALKLAKVDQAEIRERVESAADVLELRDHLDRKPAKLSGGQRQRVAMGRAIVRDPKAFLMDEPLSNLDPKLRVSMRTQVSQLQQRLGTTTVYVTHDQTEAMTLGDRLAVMRAGILQQVGSPKELYEHPANLFVAGFIGSPAMNFMPATVGSGDVRLPMLTAPLGKDLRVSGSVIAGARPEHFEAAHLVSGDRKAHGATFRVKIDVLESMGSEYYAYFAIGSEGVHTAELDELAADAGTADVPGARTGQVVARLDAAAEVRQGEEAVIWLDTSKLRFFGEGGKSLSARELSGAPA
jgi:multiple sugar transport system ATP-binding protein